MSDLGETLEGIRNLLDMLGGLIRKVVRGKRTTLFREWRYRDNTWLGAAALISILLGVGLCWELLTR